MSKLTALLDELCSDGVEFVELGSICDVRSGWGFPRSEQGVKSEVIPFFKVGDMNRRGNEIVMNVAGNYIAEATSEKLGVRPAPAGTIIFPKIGAAIATNKKRILREKSAYDNNVMGLVPRDAIDPAFLFHWIQSVNLTSWGNDSGAVPSIRKTTVEKVLIPLPPLEVQQEIVRVLDAFTDLEQSLVSELELRKKQYEEYRQETFQQVAINSPKIQLKNTGIWFGGGTPSKKEPRFWEKGNIPWISPKDMGTHVIRETQDYITQAAIEGSSTKLVPENSVALVVRSSILEHTLPIAFVPVSSALNQDMRALIPGDDILPRFFYHALCASREHLLMTARRRGGSVASLDSKKLREYEISVPSLKLQQEIVAKLDTFETLIQSIEQEISLRRQQYEFYRDELLSFAPKED